MVRAAAVRVEIADLGDWGASQLFAEYDPSGPTIRVNTRVLRRLRGRVKRLFLIRAVAHELYHHFERTGVVARLRRRAARERVAGAFASRCTW
jgi:hypothetical protein